MLFPRRSTKGFLPDPSSKLPAIRSIAEPPFLQLTRSRPRNGLRKTTRPVLLRRPAPVGAPLRLRNSAPPRAIFAFSFFISVEHNELTWAISGPSSLPALTTSSTMLRRKHPLTSSWWVPLFRADHHSFSSKRCSTPPCSSAAPPPAPAPTINVWKQSSSASCSPSQDPTAVANR